MAWFVWGSKRRATVHADTILAIKEKTDYSGPKTTLVRIDDQGKYSDTKTTTVQTQSINKSNV